MTTTSLLTIGELSRATGVAVSAIRYYDELGIVTPAGRVGGQRRFDTDTIATVKFVRRAQQTGFSLAEIKRILSDDGGDRTELVKQRLESLRTESSELNTMISLLEGIQQCGCDVVTDCPHIA